MGVAQYGPGHEQRCSRTGHYLKVPSYRKGLVVGERRYWTRESEKTRPRPGPRPMGVGAAAFPSCIARAGFNPVDSWSLLPSLQKRPRPACLQSQPVISFSSPSRLPPSSSRSSSPSASSPSSSHLPQVLRGCRVVSCLVATSWLPYGVHPDPKILSALNQTQQA